MTEYGHDNIVPFGDSALGKKEQVELMFDRIAFRYDFLNRFLSGGQDQYWRRQAIKELEKANPQKILDVATGTADMIIQMIRRLPHAEITGVDISEGMLALGRKKLAALPGGEKVTLQTGDSEHLKFPDAHFDAVTVAFGVRNFENLEMGLQEMRRVLKPGGKLIILEFSQPANSRFRRFCRFYLSRIAPYLVQLFSRKQAYEYLDKSIQAFPEGEAFLQIMRHTGFTNCYRKALSFGISSLYCGFR